MNNTPELTQLWTFKEFERLYGSFDEIRYLKINGREPFPLLIFRNSKEQTASLYSGIDDWGMEDVKMHSDMLVVGQLRFPNKDEVRYTVFDNSWNERIHVNMDPNDTWGNDGDTPISERFNLFRNGNKLGIKYKDNEIVLPAIFDTIHLGAFFWTACKDKIDGFIRVYLYTYGEGLVCIEDCTGENKKHPYQSFVDKNGNPAVVFDKSWAESNKILLSDFHIPFCYQQCYRNNVLITTTYIDKNHDIEYTLDKSGNLIKRRIITYSL